MQNKMTTNELSTGANAHTYTTLGIAAVAWYIAYTLLQPATAVAWPIVCRRLPKSRWDLC